MGVRIQLFKCRYARAGLVQVHYVQEFAPVRPGGAAGMPACLRRLHGSTLQDGRSPTPWQMLLPGSQFP